MAEQTSPPADDVREPSDAEVEAAAQAVAVELDKPIWPEGHYGIARAALKAAREAEK